MNVRDSRKGALISGLQEGIELVDTHDVDRGKERVDVEPSRSAERHDACKHEPAGRRDAQTFSQPGWCILEHV